MCNAWIWIYVIGINIVYMALLGKLWRIKKVAKLRRAQNVSVRQTIWPLRIIFLVNIVILTTWSIVDPPKYRRFDTEAKNDILGTCDSIQLPFFIPLQSILCVSVFLGFWMAYMAKYLPPELSEGGRIFHIYLGNAISFFVSVGLYSIGWLLPNLTVVIIAILLITFFTSITSVAIIIVPKMYYVWYQKKHGTLPPGVQTLGRGQTHVIVGNTSFTQHPSATFKQTRRCSGVTTSV